MPYVTVRFERVFDVVSGTHNKEQVTWFGFQQGETKKYGIPAPGKPRLRAGDAVTAFLREPDNWQTLLGWVNHETGEIVIKQPDTTVVVWLFLCGVGIASGLVLLSTPLVHVALILVTTVILASFVREHRFRQAVLKKFKEIAHERNKEAPSVTST